MRRTVRCSENIPGSDGFICRSRRCQNSSSTRSSQPKTRILRARRHRLHRPRARRRGVRPELWLQPQAAGRLHHHPAGREKLPVDQRGFLHPQDQGSLLATPPRARLFQGLASSSSISMRSIRPRRLRYRRRLAGLFRQVGERPDRRGSRVSGGDAEGAGRCIRCATAIAPSSAATTWSTACWKPAGSSRPMPRRPKRSRWSGQPFQRRAYFCRRIFRRGGPARHL